MSAARTPFGPQALTPADDAFEQRARASFARQRVMSTLGAELTSVAPGEVVIELPFREDLTQPQETSSQRPTRGRGPWRPCWRR